MEFLFQISRYDQDDLEEELAKAFEKRTELNSRKKFPGLWRFVDRRHVQPKVSESVLRWRTICYKIGGVILMSMGIFLLVPGLLEPRRLSHLLITGIIALVSGLVYVWPRRKRIASRYYKAAEKLLDGLQSFEPSKQEPVMIYFAQEGMILSDKVTIAYDDFENIIETERIYLLIWKERVTVLQKRDLRDETPEAFISFLEKKTGLENVWLK